MSLHDELASAEARLRRALDDADDLMLDDREVDRLLELRAAAATEARATRQAEREAEAERARRRALRGFQRIRLALGSTET